MKKKYGLVLAGGGTKGAYEVGVMKALKKLNVNIGMVAGASIGTINGIFEVQGEVSRLERLYKNINMSDILTISNGKLDESKKVTSIHNLSIIAGAFLKDKGVSNDALKKMIEENIDIEKMYSSKIKFGFMVYDTKTKSGKEIFLKDIPKDELVDYILASACFPIYKPQIIGKDAYRDGGLFDNMPINMVAKKGYKDIIVVDIMGIGFVQKNTHKNVNFKVIKPDESLGGTFDFDKDRMNKNIKLGYLDTLKVFHKLQGYMYYFKTKDYNRMLTKYTIKQVIGLEKAAKIYNIDRYRVYTPKMFLKLIFDEYEKREAIYLKIKKNKMNLATIKRVLNKGYGIVLCVDLLNNYPSLLNNYSGLFANYIEAGVSIAEIRNNVNIKTGNED